MDAENSMTKLRIRLGLKHLPKKQTSRTPQVIGELLTGLTRINRRYSKHKARKVIQASEGIRKEADELFNQLGSRLWPDSDERGDFPTWLLDSSDQSSGSHRLYYSNRDDHAILAELFHTFVCGRIFYHANNLNRRSEKGKHPDSSYYPNSEEPGTPRNNEISARENDTEIENNDISNHSSPRAASPENQSNTPLLVDRREMPPNIAPVAPMFQDWPPMGDHQQELGADSSEYVDHSSIQSAKQQKRKKQNRPGQLDSNMTEVCTHAPETGLAGLPFHTSLGIQPRPYGPSEQTHSLTAQHTKRPFVGGTSESSTKRCRISSSVNVPKPSLMVKFKLTPAKGVPNRGKTAPPQQSATSMPSPELPSLDEIIDRRSMAPIDRRSNMARTESWTQPADHQPIARQHMQASVESVAESDEDTTPVPNGSPPTQIAPHVSTLADAITQASSATQPQPDTNTQDSDSQAVAKFRELWSARSQPLFDQLLLDRLRQVPVEEVADCAHSFLENVRDQPPSSSTRSGMLAMSSNIGSSTSSMAWVSDNTAKGSEQMKQAAGVSPTATRSSGDASGPGIARIDTGQAQTTHATDLVEPSAIRSMGDEFECSDAELDRLVRHIDMTVRITREDGSFMMEPDMIGIEHIRSSGDFFEALRKEYERRLQPDEDLFEATVTEVDDPATEQRMRPLSLRKGSRERNWKMMLTELQRVYKRDGKDIQMKLVADVVMRKLDTYVG